VAEETAGISTTGEEPIVSKQTALNEILTDGCREAR